VNRVNAFLEAAYNNNREFEPFGGMKRQWLGRALRTERECPRFSRLQGGGEIVVVLRRQRRPLGLVGRKNFVPPGLARQVEGGGGVGRLVVVEHLEQHLAETEQRVGRLAGTRRKRPDGVKGAVDQGAGIDQAEKRRGG